MAYIETIQSAATKALPLARTAALHCFIAAFYYICIVPAAIMLKVLRVDLLKRKLEPHRITYWEEHDKVSILPNPMKHTF